MVLITGDMNANIAKKNRRKGDIQKDYEIQTRNILEVEFPSN